MSGLLHFSAEQISMLLPHQYPFLLIDRAFDIDPGKSGYGVKNYTVNEWFFQGHFPGTPIVPGVLIIESLAQLTALVYLAVHLPENIMAVSFQNKNLDVTSLKQNVGYLVKVNTKFMSPVVPGNTLTLFIAIKKKMGILSMVNVIAKNGRQVIVEGDITVSEKR